MNFRISIVIIVIILIIWDNIHITTSDGDNINRHKDSTSPYAHFSKIESINYFLYPRLLFTNPIYITLNEGEGLFIPRNWWHWIKTDRPTAAINFWYMSKKEETYKKIQYIQTIDWDSIDLENISIWSSNGINQMRVGNMGEFRKSTGEPEYTITVSDFNIGKKNKRVKDLMKEYVKPPDEIKDYDYNVWISNGIHDTGLHYDDEDGFLCVVYGKKNIILYPPKDSWCLYPFPVHKHKWLDNPTLNFRYNTNQNFGVITGKPSSHLLYETCKEYPRVLSELSKWHKKYGSNKLIWGFKKMGGVDGICRWELYHYMLDSNPCIKSWDISNSIPVKGDTSHFYFNSGKIVALPFWGYGLESNQGIVKRESDIFVIDNYDSFIENYDTYMAKLGYDTIKDKFKEIICDKYSMYEVCIFNKTKNQIFVMYIGITINEFISFLADNDYSTSIINWVKCNIKNLNINHEVAVVYDIDTCEIIRSGFYGIY